MRLLLRLVPAAILSAAVVACVLAFAPVRAAAVGICAPQVEGVYCDYVDGGPPDGVCDGPSTEPYLCDCYLVTQGYDIWTNGCVDYGAPN